MGTKALVRPTPHTALLNRRDVAERFGVAPQTITRWANEGILPCVRTLGGQRRYPADAVERLVSAVWEQGQTAGPLTLPGTHERGPGPAPSSKGGVMP